MRRGRPTGRCSVCLHPERGRIDFLICGGTPILALAKKFHGSLKQNALYRHARRHITAEYRRAVLVGPLKDDAQLRKLAAENGVSVLENLRAVYSGVQARWLVNFESGADRELAMLTDRMISLLEKQARISGELTENPTTVTNNLFLSPAFGVVQSVLLKALMRWPEAKAEVIRALRQVEADISAPQIEHQSAPQSSQA